MNIWTGLLFLDGAVADVSLARELAGEIPREPSRTTTARNDKTGAPATSWPLTGRSPVSARIE